MLDVIVLTAFGRESWLVKKLKSKNFKFVSIDVTSYFKKGVAGFTVPFGMSLEKDQDDLLKSGPIFNKQFQGWSVISDRGVVESNGFLKDYQLQLRGSLAQSFFAHHFSTFDFPFGILPKKMEQILTVPYSTYECTSVEESIVVDASEPLAIHLRAGGQFIEYKNETYKAPYLITLLDPYMCAELAAKNVSCVELANTRKIEPLYLWYPLRLRSLAAQHLSHMPKQTLVVSEADKPWLEENFIIVNKEASSDEFTVWLKVIFDLHKNEKYISELKARVQNTLAQQLKLQDAKIENHFVTPNEGLSPYPVYDQQEIQLYKKWYDRGVFHCGFEVCDSFNLDEQVRVQKLVVKGLIEENERDRQIHP